MKANSKVDKSSERYVISITDQKVRVEIVATDDSTFDTIKDANRLLKHALNLVRFLTGINKAYNEYQEFISTHVPNSSEVYDNMKLYMNAVKCNCIEDTFVFLALCSLSDHSNKTKIDTKRLEIDVHEYNAIEMIYDVISEIIANKAELHTSALTESTTKACQKFIKCYEYVVKGIVSDEYKNNNPCRYLLA